MMLLIRRYPLQQFASGICIPSRRFINSQVLSGKTAIITGASRGIGFAIAQRFAKEGVSCTLIGRNEETLKDVVDSLAPVSSTEKNTFDHVGHGYKVGDVSDVEFWKQILQDHKCQTDILINAAGITHYSNLMATTNTLVTEVVQTNLMGTIWGCQIMSKHMMRRKTGCIINISSLLGSKGGQGSSVYVASKAGVIGLTRALAAELGRRNIRVNAILPGYIETSMTDGMDPKAKSQALDAIPLKRFGKAEEVADAAVFLAQNQYASNCVLNLDGALSAM